MKNRINPLIIIDITWCFWVDLFVKMGFNFFLPSGVGACFFKFSVIRSFVHSCVYMELET